MFQDCFFYLKDFRCKIEEPSDLKKLLDSIQLQNNRNSIFGITWTGTYQKVEVSINVN